MEGSTPLELVVLEGGRARDSSVEGSRSSADLRVVRDAPANDLQAAIEETVAAARRVRREIEERIAHALDDLLRTRAPEPGPG
ncbi:MAG TPA: hypothetical protein VEB43_21060 [Anaeromyxobacter sp.]|nr:hypothetical protein [Anaeromyxobacter sp.]